MPNLRIYYQVSLVSSHTLHFLRQTDIDGNLRG